MFTPTTIPYHDHWFPSDIPHAVNLTSGLPHGQDTDILLLRCGDVRSILFTAYSEQGLPPRRLDITCVHVEPALQARNIFLYNTALVDGVDIERVWDIYFHAHIDEDTKKIVEEQAKKGKYGPILPFWDAASLRQVRETWANSKDISCSQGLAKDICREKIIVAGINSTAPLSFASRDGVTSSCEHSWECGHLSKQPATLPNPTDPISGFHTATAFAKLAPGSPLSFNAGKDGGETVHVVQAGKNQFREWAASFQKALGGRIILRFAVSDGLRFAHALQTISSLGGTRPSLHHRQPDITPIQFDTGASKAKTPAPVRFDLIDTSGLNYRVGALNVLVATGPLLKLSEKATQKLPLDAFLGGHAPTVSLLLGLVPIDYWTNATSVSCTHEVLRNAIIASSTWPLRSNSRLPWKLSTTFLRKQGSSESLFVEPGALAGSTFHIFTKMFKDEKVTTRLSSGLGEFTGELTDTMYPRSHRGSFAALLKRVEENISTDWPNFWEQLLRMIDRDSEDMTTWLEADVMPIPGEGRFHAWRHIPEVVCLTVTVPRQHIDSIYGTDLTKMNVPPALEGQLRSSGLDDSQKLFSSVDVVFGHVDTSGDRISEDFSITVRQDPLSWKGASPVVVSYYVPSSALQAEPDGVEVGLCIRNTIKNKYTLKDHIPTMDIYMTNLSNESHVFVTKHAPGMSNRSFTSNQIDGDTANSGNTIDTPQTNVPAAIRFTVNLEGDEIKSLCARVSFSSQKDKALLTERLPMKLEQSSPFSMDIIFGGKSTVVYPVSFPAPVLKETARTRIARTSGYVEITALVPDPLASELSSSFIYPTMLGKDSVPILLNSQHVNLDSLPVLNVDRVHKKANAWLCTLASYQFSARERRMRDLSMPDQGISNSVRLDFEESPFTIFMLASGLQGVQIGLFALRYPPDGNQILIFVRAIRLNGAESSVVADAVAISVTRQLIDSGELAEFPLILRELEMCVVDIICSCGNGKFAERFVSIPGWENVSQYAVRLAISPTFAVPFIEDVVDGKGGGRLLKCTRCKEAMYCSPECQRKDWKKHRMECEPSDATAG
ncbi:hypothetical protein GGS23DRAFT_604876 [Durotheca rogersii]|uniref:uncharacterized protein n=1 Tax=Durotheca rogersii TaxID=419775 RepID=UPI00221EE4AA|nr:uncharacterized protein GGS23DRAFT_604876 [Durotheca rogersii]KAI5863942.1 hypothetical protein GGS23DRAFT_604876 [Durotheca rogersii]